MDSGDIIIVGRGSVVKYLFAFSPAIILSIYGVINVGFHDFFRISYSEANHFGRNGVAFQIVGFACMAYIVYKFFYYFAFGGNFLYIKNGYLYNYRNKILNISDRKITDISFDDRMPPAIIIKDEDGNSHRILTFPLRVSRESFVQELQEKLKAALPEN